MTEIRERPSPIRPDYPEPLWIQAVNLIKDEVASGALSGGSRLPPERELCQQLRISRVTLRKALNQLVEDGVLSPSHGRGWYVSGAAPRRDWPDSLESFTETARRMGLTASSTVLRAETSAASMDEAEELSIAPGTPLFHLERVRELDGVPIALDLTRIPAHLAPELAAADFRHESLFSRLAEAGVEMARAESTIEAREAEGESARLLGLEAGKPMLVMHQVVVDRLDRPLFTSTIRYNGERYRLRTSFVRNAPARAPGRRG